MFFIALSKYRISGTQIVSIPVEFTTHITPHSAV